MSDNERTDTGVVASLRRRVNGSRTLQWRMGTWYACLVREKRERSLCVERDGAPTADLAQTSLSGTVMASHAVRAERGRVCVACVAFRGPP